MIQKFTIEVEMQEQWIPHFLSMLRYMEFLGKHQKSRQVAIFSDGEGVLKPKFTWSIPIQLVDPVADEDGDRLYDITTEI